MPEFKPFAGCPRGWASLPPERIEQMVADHKKRFGDTPRKFIFDKFLEEYGEYGILSGPESVMTPERVAELKQHMLAAEEYVRSLSLCENPTH